ncbi:MAG: phage exclusion protein Lit family protein [Gemmatimonadota bacterium]
MSVAVSQPFPKDSPVVPFLNAIAGSLVNVAPEKGAAIQEELVKLKVRLVVDQSTDSLFKARLRDGRPDICCSVYGAEVLWAAAFGYIAVHRRLKEFGGSTIVFAEIDCTAHLPELLSFAFDRRYGQQDERPWPVQLPRPEAYESPQEINDVNLSTELWLCAVAWILHHEVTHVRLGHLQKGDYELRDEVAADEGATNWLLEGVTDPGIALKRSLGIAIAVVANAAFALHRNIRGSIGSRTHPPAGERILRAMSHTSLADDHQAQELAAVAVKIHLDRFEMAAPLGPFANSSDCLNAYCGTLTTWELRR